MANNEAGPDEHNSASYGLICPFLDSDPRFAHGVEFGMLYARMKHGDENAIGGYFLTANQEQITLLANRLGWTIHYMEPWAAHPDQWFYLAMERPD